LKGLVVFDLDGTLVPEKSSWRRIYERFGIQEVSDDNFRRFEKGLMSYTELVSQTAAELRRAGLKKDDIASLFKDPHVVDGAAELVDQLKRDGWEVAIISAGVCDLVRRIAELLGIEKRFCNEILYDEGGLISGIKVGVDPSNKGQVLEALARDLNVDKEHVVAVGDHPMDGSMFARAGHYVVVGEDGDVGPRGRRAKSLREVSAIIKLWYR